jgi:hypothetical protein
MIKQIGIYHTQNGEEYDCTYSPGVEGAGVASAIGPLPIQGYDNPRSKVEIVATSEEEARRKLSEKLGPGSFMGTWEQGEGE